MSHFQSSKFQSLCTMWEKSAGTSQLSPWNPFSRLNCASRSHLESSYHICNVHNSFLYCVLTQQSFFSLLKFSEAGSSILTVTYLAWFLRSQRSLWILPEFVLLFFPSSMFCLNMELLGADWICLLVVISRTCFQRTAVMVFYGLH